jgi:hypothetical protein
MKTLGAWISNYYCGLVLTTAAVSSVEAQVEYQPSDLVQRVAIPVARPMRRAAPGQILRKDFYDPV